MKRLNALSIDGGGIKGIGVAFYLMKLEQRIGKPINNLFHAYAGTSTGSIIVALLNEGYNAHEIYELYRKEAKNIFNKNSKVKRMLPGVPKYSNKKYLKLLKDMLKGKMSDWSKPIFIPTCKTDSLNTEKIFDVGDVDIEKWFAVQASSAAPTYFEPAGNGKNYIDGGLYMNNPITALQAGLERTHLKDNYKILSFATGMQNPKDITSGNKTLLGWASYLLDTWLTSAGESGTFVARMNLNDTDVLRLNPLCPKQIKMDDITKMDDIESVWSDLFENSYKEVLKFLGV